MRCIVKPSVNFVSMRPLSYSVKQWVVEYEIETRNGKFTGNIEIEHSLVVNSLEEDKLNETIVDELIKDLKGREIN